MMARRKREQRMRVADAILHMQRDAERARRSARLAMSGAWTGVKVEDAYTYARHRLEDADIIESVYTPQPTGTVGTEPEDRG